MRSAFFLASILALAACKGPPSIEAVHGDPVSSAAPSASAAIPLAQLSTAALAAAAAKPALRLGAPVTGQPVKLADIAKNAASYKGKTFVTSGTVTSVCQKMGCWMEIKDETSQAHIKMSGESFFVPKTSAGHTARVQGSLVSVPTTEEVECSEEATKQMGHPVAKMQLVATGVELD